MKGEPAMRQLPQTFALVAVDRLVPHPRNPRQGDVAALRESLDANGWYGAVVAQRGTGRILAGNHRWRAAVQRGAKELPVLLVDCDDATALRILLADNRTSDRAAYDDAGLAELLQEVQAAGSLAGTGYADADLRQLLADLGAAVAEEDFPEAPDQSGALSDKHQVLVECADEAAQTALLRQLTTEGWRCRALVS